MSTDSFSLQEKVAIVTGASRGIGEAIAREFSRRGARVVLVSRDAHALRRVAEGIAGDGGAAEPIPCHLGRTADVEAFWQGVAATSGRVDVLVNNAATNLAFGPAIDVSEVAYDKTFALNLKSCFLMCQHAARLMLPRKSGAIVNIASVGGLSPSVDQVVYGMTKAAMISMTRGLAKEWGPQGIRVNAIAPGLVDTRFASVLVNDPAVRDPLVLHTPMRRIGHVDDIVGAAVYLASGAASYVTGSVLVCDGGLTA